mgnify:CR=1 FL=1
MTFTPLEMDILYDLERNGDNVPGNIAENTGRHEKAVSRSLSGADDSLANQGLVRSKGRGVWTITEEGQSQLAEFIDGALESES